MSKQKTSKTLFKRVKVTGTGKLTRRHQLGSGHKKSNKSKSALERAKKSQSVFKGDTKKYKELLAGAR